MKTNNIVAQNIEHGMKKQAEKDQALKAEADINAAAKLKYLANLVTIKKMESLEAIIMILKDPPINIKDYENQEKNASRIKEEYTLLLLNKMIELKTADKFPIDKLSFEQMITLMKFLNKYWGSYDSYNKKADAKTNSDAFRTFNNTFLLKVHSAVVKKLGSCALCCLVSDKNTL